MSIPQKYKNTKFIRSLKKDIQDLINEGQVTQASELNNYLNEAQFRTDCPPVYYTGNLSSDYAFIMQNPYRKEDDSSTKKLEGITLNNIDDYIDVLENFGTYKLKKYNRLRSFDTKQLNFINGLGLYTDQNFSSDKERYIYIRNNKLQLEAIPYASQTFKTGVLNKNPDFFKPYFDRIFEVLTKEVRKKILFLGNFNTFFKKAYSISSICTYKFKKATKKDGEPMAYSPKLSKIEFDNIQKPSPIWVANTYASQSLRGDLIEKYGNFCREKMSN